MEKVYYSLAVRTGTTWGVEFGDYERGAVQDELDQLKESGEHKAKDLKIIVTTDAQADIEQAVGFMNGRQPIVGHSRGVQ